MAGALALGLLLSLLLGEIVVRVLGLGHTTLSKGRLHAHDPDAGWTGAPGVDARFAKPRSFDVRVRHNSRGLRGPERAFAKPAGVRRVVLLGDSMVWGQGVADDETVSAVIERRLPATEAINLAANGYSTVQQWIRLEMEGLRYAPDWTVLFVTENDLEDNVDDKDGGRPVVVPDGEGGFAIANRPVRRAWKSGHTQWLRHHSRLFNYLEYAGEIGELRRRFRARAAGEVKPRARRSAGAARSPDLPDRAWRWEALRYLVGRIDALAARDGGRLLVVYNTSQAEIRVARAAPSRDAERLGALCASLGLPFVDPSPDFFAHPDPERLFLAHDPHWSPAGAALVGGRVAAALRSLDAR